MDAMSAAAITVRYDGPVLSDHRMDVADLAPALLGLSDLCKIANEKFNGESTSVKVLIGTDIEHQCFQFDLHVVQSLWDATKAILLREEVAHAKNFLEWIGITGGSAYGLFQLLKLLRGRKIASTSMEVKDGRHVVQIKLDGDNNHVLIAHPEALALLRDERAISSAKKVVQPLTREGYDKVEFQSNTTTEVISKQDAAAISETASAKLEDSKKEEPQLLTAWISVYSPVYDIKAPMWRFKFGDIREYMDITETDIAAMAMKRGGALVDDSYRVELELTQEQKPDGSFSNHYKIKRVLDFKPARIPHQSDAFHQPSH